MDYVITFLPFVYIADRLQWVDIFICYSYVATHIVMIMYMLPGLRKPVLSTQNTNFHVLVPISYSVWVIQNL